MHMQKVKINNVPLQNDDDDDDEMEEEDVFVYFISKSIYLY